MKKRFKTPLFIFTAYLLFLAGGCAVPEYIPPKLEKPTGPLSLDAAVGLAIRNNPNVAMAKERLGAASACFLF